MDNDIVQTYGAGDKMAEQVAAYLDLEREAEAVALKLTKQRQDLIDRILDLDDSRYTEVLYKYYVEEKRLNVIASEMGYTYGTIRHMIRHAEQAFDEK